MNSRRQMVWAKGQRCYYCKLFMAKEFKDTRIAEVNPRAMTVEHLKPKSRGGTSNPSNLVGAHLVCNILRSSNMNLPKNFVAVCRVAVQRNSIRNLGGLFNPRSPFYYKHGPVKK